MLDQLQIFAAGIGAVLSGIAAGAAWIVTMAAPNCSFDRLDGSRADGHVRQLLRDTSTPIAGILLAAAAFSILGGAIAGGTVAALAAFGFFSNRFTLAPKKKGEARVSRKGQRVISVSFSLIFGIVALIAAILAVFGV